MQGDELDRVELADDLAKAHVEVFGGSHDYHRRAYELAIRNRIKELETNNG